MSAFFLDLRSASRGFYRRPGFSALVVVTLGVGIGAAVTIFGLFHAVLLRPLPFRAPQQLAMVWERNIPRDRARNVVSPANFLAWREQNRVFSGMAAFAPDRETLTGEGEPVRLASVAVTEGFFELLEIEPFLGRSFDPDELAPGSDRRVVLLTHQAWRGRFGADPEIVGRELRLNDRPHRVIGVLPEDFRFVLEASASTFAVSGELYLPLSISEEWREREGRSMLVLARLRDGVRLDRAQTEMETIAARLERDYPDFNTGWSVNLVPLHEQMVGQHRATLIVILGAVFLVLLIACVNVATLFLERGFGRRRELAIRGTLGAGRSRLLRQLLTESAILAAVAAAIGIFFSWLGIALLKGFTHLELPRLEMLSLNGRVLAFALGLTVATALIFGLVPAMRLSRAEPQVVLRSGIGAARDQKRLRSGLVVCEIAIAVVLLLAAGLMVKTFRGLSGVEAGFERAGTVTMRISLPSARYGSDAERVGFYDALLSRLEPLPTVEAAGMVSSLPLTGPHAATSFYADGGPPPARGEAPVADIRIIQGDYFRAMGIPLLAGRGFDGRDDEGVPLRAVVSERTAATLWPGVALTDLPGRVVQISWGGYIPAEILGVVGDVRHAALGTVPRPMIYWSNRQQGWGVLTLAVRTRGAPEEQIGAIQSQVWSLDSQLPTYAIRTLAGVVSDSLTSERVTTLVLAVFSMAALLIAALGVYGMIAFSVSQRRREMGLRLALGAAPSRVVWLVLRQGAILAAAGILLGLFAAAAGTRWLASLLYGVGSFDLPTVLAVSLTLVAVALCATYLPARRVSKVDPSLALRLE